MKIIWDRKKITDGEVSFYNAPRYLSYHLMKCKSLHLAQTLQYEQAVECAFWQENIGLYVILLFGK